MLRLARPAAGHNRDLHGLADGASHFNIVTGQCAVGIHDVEHNLPGSQPLGFNGPVQNLPPDAHPTAVDEHFPELRTVGAFDPIGIEPQNGGTAAEFSRNFGNKAGIFDRRGINADFFGAGLDKGGGIVDGANTATDRDGHEHPVSHPPHDIRHDLPAFMAGGNIVKHKLIGAGLIIKNSLLFRITGIHMVKEANALDDSTAIHIQTGNDSFC